MQTKYFDMCNKDKSVIDKFLDDDAPELEEEIDEETEKLLELLAVEIIEIDDCELYDCEIDNIE